MMTSSGVFQGCWNRACSFPWSPRICGHTSSRKPPEKGDNSWTLTKVIKRRGRLPRRIAKVAVLSFAISESCPHQARLKPRSKTLPPFVNVNESRPKSKKDFQARVPFFHLLGSASMWLASSKTSEKQWPCKKMGTEFEISRQKRGTQFTADARRRVSRCALKFNLFTSSSICALLAPYEKCLLPRSASSAAISKSFDGSSICNKRQGKSQSFSGLCSTYKKFSCISSC